MTSHGIQTRSATDPAAKQDGRRISIALVRAVGGPAPVAGPSIAATVSLAGRVAVALTIACGAIALVVHAWFGAAARGWLAFPFAGIPARPGEAASIFIHNLRVLAAVGGLLLCLRLTPPDCGSLGGCGDPLCVVPLCCTPCHRAYDEGRLDLLPHLEPAWRAQLAHAVGHVGLIGALRRISGRSGPAGNRPPGIRLPNRPREDLP